MRIRSFNRGWEYLKGLHGLNLVCRGWEETGELGWESKTGARIGEDAYRLGWKWCLIFCSCHDKRLIWHDSVRMGRRGEILVRWQRGANIVTDYQCLDMRDDKRIALEDKGMGMQIYGVGVEVQHPLLARTCWDAFIRDNIAWDYSPGENDVELFIDQIIRR